MKANVVTKTITLPSKTVETLQKYAEEEGKGFDELMSFLVVSQVNALENKDYKDSILTAWKDYTENGPAAILDPEEDVATHINSILS